jgi:hypothetical protein
MVVGPFCYSKPIEAVAVVMVSMPHSMDSQLHVPQGTNRVIVREAEREGER